MGVFILAVFYFLAVIAVSSSIRDTLITLSRSRLGMINGSGNFGMYLAVISVSSAMRDTVITLGRNSSNVSWMFPFGVFWFILAAVVVSSAMRDTVVTLSQNWLELD